MRLRLLLLSLLLVTACCRPDRERAPSTESRPSSGFELPSTEGNTSNQSFSKAKKYMMAVYDGQRETFYCGCVFDERGKVQREACGYVPMRESKRSKRIEWEHVVPAHAFGQSFEAWRSGHPDCVNRKGKAFRGRQCARKTAIPFRYMEADMYNLYPAIGELNQRRSNFSMALIPGEARAFGRCDFEIGGRKIEPRPQVRGDVARTYMYMQAAYPGRGILSDKNRALFRAWSEADPVDRWECERARRIAELQGNVNEIVAQACRAAGL